MKNLRKCNALDSGQIVIQGPQHVIRIRELPLPTVVLDAQLEALLPWCKPPVGSPPKTRNTNVSITNQNNHILRIRS